MKQFKAFENCAVEFCITNEYIIKGKSWNCIDHWLNKSENQFNKSDLQYLKALNNSYVSVYQIISVVPGQSMELQNMIETDELPIIIANKAMSKTVLEQWYIHHCDELAHKTNKPAFH